MTRNDVLRLAGEAQVDPGVVRRFVDGAKVRPASARVVTEAAARLGITLPAAASTSAGGSRAA